MNSDITTHGLTYHTDFRQPPHQAACGLDYITTFDVTRSGASRVVSEVPVSGYLLIAQSETIVTAYASTFGSQGVPAYSDVPSHHFGCAALIVWVGSKSVALPLSYRGLFCLRAFRPFHVGVIEWQFGQSTLRLLILLSVLIPLM